MLHDDWAIIVTHGALLCFNFMYLSHQDKEVAGILPALIFNHGLPHLFLWQVVGAVQGPLACANLLAVAIFEKLFLTS
jgi:hypothetical protein